MKRSELLDQIEAYLALNVHVADETAEGLKFLRLAYMQLRNPSVNDAEAAALRADLTSADQTIAALNDKNAEYSDVLYDLLLQTGLLPEIDGEPVLTFEMAIKEDPDCIEKLKNGLVIDLSVEAEKQDYSRFATAVYNLLGVDYSAGLEALYNRLEDKAQYLSSLEAGIAQRDTQLQHNETLISSCLEAAGEDWQDVDGLPKIIRGMRNDLENLVMGENCTVKLSDWTQDAIDLAHAVHGDLSPENRVMAKAAEQIILNAPKGEA